MRPAAALVVSVAVVLGASACSTFGTTLPVAGTAPEPSGGAVLVHDPAPTADEGGPTDATTDGLVLRSRVTRVAGHLSETRRERVAQEARAAVADYLEAAFVTGDRPFRGFVEALRREARADAPVLRGDEQPDRPGVTRAAAWFSVAAPDGRPVGVTARVRVELASDGAPAATLTGRLLLTEEDQQWRVFGYDLARGER